MMPDTEETEMLEDVRDYDAAMQRIAEGEALIPGEVTFAILDGANPVKVWREHRGLSRRRLAEAAGLSASYLSQIETGARQGSVAALSALAGALGVAVDDVIVVERG